MNGPMVQLPADDPMMQAWAAYKATPEYKNSVRWALTIAPMLQAGDPEAETKRLSLAPIEQRTQHVEGSMWAAFSAGFRATEGDLA